MLFAALTVVFGAVTHLVSEFFALGASRDAALILSDRHMPLLATVVGVLAVLPLALRPADGATRVSAADFAAKLPFRGSGMPFVTLAFFAQLAFAACTQLLEGAPIASGDVSAGAIAGALLAGIVAVVLHFANKRLIEVAFELFWFLSETRSSSVAETAEDTVCDIVREGVPYLSLYATRPPPTTIVG